MCVVYSSRQLTLCKKVNHIFPKMLNLSSNKVSTCADAKTTDQISISRGSHKVGMDKALLCIIVSIYVLIFWSSWNVHWEALFLIAWFIRPVGQNLKIFHFERYKTEKNISLEMLTPVMVWYISWQITSINSQLMVMNIQLINY